MTQAIAYDVELASIGIENMNGTLSLLPAEKPAIAVNEVMIDENNRINGQVGDILSCPIQTTDYQWYKGNVSNAIAIANATDYFFQPSAAGHYFVETHQ